jgi:molybdenum cofactor cytidylyltransferase
MSDGVTPLRLMGVLLAAGGGSRFGERSTSHKLLAEIDGLPLWRHSLGHLLAARLDETVVVTGAAAIDREIAGIAGKDVRILRNDAWASGQASSLQLAVEAAREAGVDAIVVGLADQPFVAAEAWRAVGDAAATCDLVVATYAGTWGPNPVRIAARHWPELPDTGDEGARGLLRRLRDDVCTVACVGSPADIDTPEDLARWTSS